MSISMRRDELLRYYEELKALPQKPPMNGGAWLKEPVVVPQMVLDADENDVFAWGFTIGDDGRCGGAPLHKCGRYDSDGKFHFIRYGGPTTPELTVVPNEPLDEPQ